MDAIHEETRHGLNIKIYRDEDTNAADYVDAGLFLVGYHRSFWVEGPKEKGALVVTRGAAVALLGGDREPDADAARPLRARYHVFHLEAYIHSGVALALGGSIEAARFPDRRWDVSSVGAVFVARSEWKTRAKAEKAARGLVQTWNDTMSGNVYGYVVEKPDGTHVDSCWGFVGDYADKNGGALAEARGVVDRVTKGGTTDASGQLLFPWAPERVGAPAAA